MGVAILLRDKSRLCDAVADLVALGLILAALTVALQTTRGLTAPDDPDEFRDVAQAQTVRDGHPLTDQVPIAVNGSGTTPCLPGCLRWHRP